MILIPSYCWIELQYINLLRRIQPAPYCVVIWLMQVSSSSKFVWHLLSFPSVSPVLGTVPGTQQMPGKRVWEEEMPGCVKVPFSPEIPASFDPGTVQWVTIQSATLVFMANQWPSCRVASEDWRAVVNWIISLRSPLPRIREMYTYTLRQLTV